MQKLCMTIARYLFTPFGIRCAHYLECGADVKTHKRAGTTPHGLKLLNVLLRYVCCQVSRFQLRFPWSGDQPFRSGTKAWLEARSHSSWRLGTETELFSEGLNCILGVLLVVHRRTQLCATQWLSSKMAPERENDPSRSTETDRVPRSLTIPAAPDMPPIVHGVVNGVCQSRRNEHLVEVRTA